MSGLSAAGQRLAKAACGVLLAAVALSGCGPGPSFWEPSIGANERTPHMLALGVAAVTDRGDTARLVGTLLNRGERSNRLVGVRA